MNNYVAGKNSSGYAYVLVTSLAGVDQTANFTGISNWNNGSGCLVDPPEPWQP